MLSLWRTMISREEAAISNMTGAVANGRIQPPRGKGKHGCSHHAAQRNVPRERDDSHENSSSATSTAVGASARNAPTAVATPLPPLKRSQTGNM